MAGDRRASRFDTLRELCVRARDDAILSAVRALVLETRRAMLDAPQLSSREREQLRTKTIL